MKHVQLQSPHTIHTILWVYTGSPLPSDNATREALEVLSKDELLIKGSTLSDLKLTEKGVAWVNSILSTPYPVHRWLDPREAE